MNHLEHNEKKEIPANGEIKFEKNHSSEFLKSESENKFRNLIEFAVDGILVGSHEGYITEANSCFCSMIGRKKENLIGKHINHSGLLFTTESLEKVPLRFDLLEKGENVISEREILRPDGSILMVEMRTKMMPDGAYQSIFRDITERIKHETRIQKYADELSKLNRDKDLFISILAHDLSNHFNSILGFLDLIKDNIRVLTIEDTEEQINMLHKSAKTAFNLLKDLLIWTQAQSGFIHFEPKHLNLRGISEYVINNLNVYAINKNISMNCEVPVGLHAKADEQVLKTIMRNLIANAIKFTPPNGKINISAEKNNREITVTVTDTGVGISPDVQSKLFHDFNVYSSKGFGAGKKRYHLPA